MILTPGLMVGNVMLRHRIAEGGMASVWAGEQLALNREVAVKFLTRGPGTDERAVERFAFEARLIARISSPHVPEVFDHAIAADGTPYIVMELVAGADLRSWVIERGPLDLMTMVRLVEQLCLALEAAHQLAVVHRDVKPENILVCADGPDFRIKLVDFGIAKAPTLSWSRANLTQEGGILGTPGYMSPEQLTGESEVDERSDLWSVGVVAYWALTGSLPFGANCFEATANAVLSVHFTPPSDLRPELPKEIDQWFEKALCREPGGRFQSAAIMSKMLKVAAMEPTEWVQLSVPHTLGTDPDIRVSAHPSSCVPPSGPVRAETNRRRSALYAGAGAGVTVLLFLAATALIDTLPAPAPLSNQARTEENNAATLTPTARVAAETGGRMGIERGQASTVTMDHDPSDTSLTESAVTQPVALNSLVSLKPAAFASRGSLKKSRAAASPARLRSEPHNPPPVIVAKPETQPPPAPMDWQAGEELGEPRALPVSADAGTKPGESM